MKTLTIYTKTFDDNENVSNNGFSDTVYIDDQKYGDECKAFYNKKEGNDNLQDALIDITKNKTEINEICFNYYDKEDNCQKYMKFKIK